MTPSDDIKRFIKEQEGCQLTAYHCPAGVLTIGWGHTGSDVFEGRRISQAKADSIFEDDIRRFAATLDDWMAVDRCPALAQHQYDALLSFAYNVGISAFRCSTLWRKVCHDPADCTIPNEFRRWVHSKGKVLPGLVARRAKEAKIYCSDD